jgi:antitoxin component YwqK of YwqJK toxin-antitoxin module
MRYLFILLSFLFTATACSPLETVENKDDNGVLIEKYSRRKDTRAKEGLYQSFYSNGQLMEESAYLNDSLHGERKLFYENGTLQSTEQRDHDQFTGPYRKYYENGKLSNEGQYITNEMSGVWKRWYDTGELMEEITFAHNEENGPFKEYYKNGKLKAEGEYLQGENENGELKKYAETGELVEKMHCELGVCMTIWTKEAGNIRLDSTRLRELVELKKRVF